MDAQAAFTGTVVPEGADKLDEASLTRWFEENVPTEARAAAWEGSVAQ